MRCQIFFRLFIILLALYVVLLETISLLIGCAGKHQIICYVATAIGLKFDRKSDLDSKSFKRLHVTKKKEIPREETVLYNFLYSRHNISQINRKYVYFCRGLDNLSEIQVAQKAKRFSLQVNGGYYYVQFIKALCNAVKDGRPLVSTNLLNTSAVDTWKFFLVNNIPSNNITVKIISEAPVPRSFTDISRSILKDYCDHHGYQLLSFRNFPTNSAFNPSWKKTIYIREAMKSSPVGTIIVWLDDDVMITNFSIKIENYFYLSEGRKVEFVAGQGSIRLYPDALFNCGALLIRNSLVMRNFVQSVIDGHAIWKVFKTFSPWEQSVMNMRYYENVAVRQRSLIVPLGLLQAMAKWRPGDFLLHLPGNSTRNKLAEMQRILRTYPIRIS